MLRGSADSTFLVLGGRGVSGLCAATGRRLFHVLRGAGRRAALRAVETLCRRFPKILGRAPLPGGKRDNNHDERPCPAYRSRILPLGIRTLLRLHGTR